MTLRETCRSRPAHGDSWPGRRKTSPHPPAQRRTGQREAGAQVIEDSPDGGLAVGSKREGMWGSHGVVPYEVRQGAVSPVGCDSTTLAPAGGEQTVSLGSRGIRPSCEQASSPADLGSRHKTTPAAGPTRFCQHVLKDHESRLRGDRTDRIPGSSNLSFSDALRRLLQWKRLCCAQYDA